MDAGERAKMMQKRLLEMTTLKVSNEKVFQPAEARMQQTAGGALMLFAFPRNELKLGPVKQAVAVVRTPGDGLWGSNDAHGGALLKIHTGSDTRCSERPGPRDRNASAFASPASAARSRPPTRWSAARHSTGWAMDW